MMLGNIIVQLSIIAGLVILFITVVVLNLKTKVPEGADLPEECRACNSPTCMVSTNKIEQMKQEILNSDTTVKEEQ